MKSTDIEVRLNAQISANNLQCANIDSEMYITFRDGVDPKYKHLCIHEPDRVFNFLVTTNDILHEIRVAQCVAQDKVIIK